MKTDRCELGVLEVKLKRFIPEDPLARKVSGT